ncbi:protein-L-isoaspartate carboxylmethyltransferase [Nocardioides sp. BP30]|uniref:protein-L-isoaspartate O-methyltransferase family protein n=1 Tax=Nocardioides sp. BP30 TaxID=3036374 RepID=UPI0024697AE4|nr:protein-L-isoaspartate carboxylmethyltransferase [Nocardioides sp. BP30]WGL52115.1 protein-L-isoaspartate carboxylmethyltransferase [Nocardioides sp. BP30]
MERAVVEGIPGVMDRVDAAFAAVPRAGFLPRAERARAGDDAPLPIGHRQTNSQPRTVAAMLRLLEVVAGQRVLDVGAGSGWTTALLAHLTGPEGEVVGVELEPDLVRWGGANLAATGRRWATIRLARKGELGVPERAPYDRILVSADAGELPRALLDQLADPGRLVIPVAGTMTLVVREQAYDAVSHHGSYRFVPLR